MSEKLHHDTDVAGRHFSRTGGRHSRIRGFFTLFALLLCMTADPAQRTQYFRASYMDRAGNAD